MEQRHLLTLLSDFGLSDSYVGSMKGVIAQVNSALPVIDLTHQIPPQNVALARFVLMTAYPYFPAGTVHVAVVDPGVGSPRRAIALAIGHNVAPAIGHNMAQPTGFLVGPDNGLFSGVLADYPILAAVELTNSQYWRTSALSATFHGRDIFAPVGAHLASGVALDQLGTRIAPETLVRLDVPQCSQPDVYDGAIANSTIGSRTAKITGCIQAVDHFGNLITNIPGAQVVGKHWTLLVADTRLPGKQTYSDSQPGDLLALVGSHGWVEIAVNGGSAQARLNVTLGELISVKVEISINY